MVNSTSELEDDTTVMLLLTCSL